MNESPKHAPFLVPAFEEFEELGYPPNYEIPLARLTDDLLIAADAPSWCHKALKDPEQAWRERIAVAADEIDPVRHFASEFRQYEPVSLVFSRGNAWWRATHPEMDDWILLGPRGSTDESTPGISASEANRFADTLCLSTYLRGYREDIPPSGGMIEEPGDNVLLRSQELVQDFGDFALGEAWDPLMRLFTARNGDLLIVNLQGQCGWWEAGSESGIVLFAESLTECVEKWLAFRSRARRGPEPGWPFDAYSERFLNKPD